MDGVKEWRSVAALKHYRKLASGLLTLEGSRVFGGGLLFEDWRREPAKPILDASVGNCFSKFD